LQPAVRGNGAATLIFRDEKLPAVISKAPGNRAAKMQDYCQTPKNNWAVIS